VHNNTKIISFDYYITQKNCIHVEPHNGIITK